MKHVYIISLVLISASLQSMENPVEQSSTQAPLWQEAHDSLKAVFKKYVGAYIEKTEKDKIDIKKLQVQSKWTTNSLDSLKEALSEYKNEQDNNFAHILIEHHNADALYQCADMGILREIDDKTYVTLYDLAIEKFSSVINSENFEKVNSRATCSQKCCFYIIYNYMKTKENNDKRYEYYPYIPCCDSHK